MQLPPELSQAIQLEIEHVDRAQLAQAAAQLTKRYRAEDFSSRAIQTESQRAAYLAVRVPATFAANLHVFSKIRQLYPEAEITSILDLGAGPGTTMYAASETFSSLTQATMIEVDRSLIEFGKRAGRSSPHAVLRNSRWLQQDITAGLSCEPHDLVVISYFLNEIPQAVARRTVLQAWGCARELLAIVEPGTMRGFALVNDARTQLIGAGAHILAPCPHAGECPMAAAGDWCHFAKRVERTSLHRWLKSGTLGHEDEKFSYVVASRRSLTSAGTRIVRHPQKHGGHVQLTLCTPEGLQSLTVSRSQQEAYKLARKAEWGDAWEDVLTS